MTGQPATTVIVPVHGGRDATMRCLASLVGHAASISTPFEILVIDDCSPDEGVRTELEDFAAAPQPVPVRVAANATNLGFVRTVNRGMSETEGDVVLLNSDTVVTEGWLDRMTAVAASGHDVATVTPLTNAGSICTLPAPVVERFALSGPTPQIDECGAFVRRFGLGARPQVITGVGFCMLVRRAAIEACGLFDDATFGRGYGEEVDFCQRAGLMGFTHLVDDETFVFHEEGVSFGATRATGMTRAQALVDERYPSFTPANRRERAQDPLAVSFEALVLALDERRPGRPHVLHLLHAPSTPAGGTERHVAALVESLAHEVDSSVLHPVGEGFLLRSSFMTTRGDWVTHDHLLPGHPVDNSTIDDAVAGAALEMAFDLFDFDAVHIHNMLGHSLAPLRVCGGFDGPVLCTLHDLYVACPNQVLLYKGERACGIPDDLGVCAACLPVTHPAASADDLEAFREFAADHLATVDRFVVADIVTADQLRRLYELPADRVEVIEHGVLIGSQEPPPVDEGNLLEGDLRFALVGRGWSKKGLDTLNLLARELTGTGMEFHHFGEAHETVDDAVHAHGPYDNADLPRLLHASGIHVVLLPGPCAETYSYVMSEAIAAGLPVIGAGYGALGHRIREHGVGWTIDPADPGTVRELVENLDRCRPEVLRATRRARDLSIIAATELADRYIALYREPARRSPSAAPTRRTTTTMSDDNDLMRRHLQALSAVNWRLHAQLAAQPRRRAVRLAARVHEALERSAPRIGRVIEVGLETADTTLELVRGAQSSVRRRSGPR